MTFLSQISHSQGLDKEYFNFNPDTLDFSSNDKVLKQKTFIINCMDYILTHKPGHLSLAKTHCLGVILKLNENDTYNITKMDIYPVKLVQGGNMAYEVVFWAGLTKCRLTDPELLMNEKELLKRSIDLFLDYCNMPDNKVILSKERKEAIKFKESNNLKSYIEKLYLDNEKRKKKNTI